MYQLSALKLARVWPKRQTDEVLMLGAGLVVIGACGGLYGINTAAYRGAVPFISWESWWTIGQGSGG